jgi:hypothetical protein
LVEVPVLRTPDFVGHLLITMVSSTLPGVRSWLLAME